MAYADPERERQYRAERAAVYRSRYPEKAKASITRWRENNRDKDRAAAKRWAKEHPKEAKAIARRNQLRVRYGITPEDYIFLFEAQGGVCAICGNENTGGRNLCVDHNHETGKVRGLLCTSCNTGVGYHERPIHAAIVEYIENHNA